MGATTKRPASSVRRSLKPNEWAVPLAMRNLPGLS